MSLNIFSSRINHNDDDDNGYLQGFCEQILKIDYFIRSAIIVDHLGHIIASASRPGLIQLMSHEESARAAVQAVIRSATRDKFKSKIGNLLFSISMIFLERLNLQSLFNKTMMQRINHSCY